jgi:hypothetical protein
MVGKIIRAPKPSVRLPHRERMAKIALWIGGLHTLVGLAFCRQFVYFGFEGMRSFLIVAFFSAAYSFAAATEVITVGRATFDFDAQSPLLTAGQQAFFPYKEAVNGHDEASLDIAAGRLHEQLRHRKPRVDLARSG